MNLDRAHNRDRSVGKVAYLTSYYPAISHTFIRREVQALRAAGFDVRTYAIQPIIGRDVLAEVDRDEADRTRYILARGKGSLIFELLRSIMRHPSAFAATALAAFRSVNGPRRRLWQCFYACEAAILQRWMARDKISHIHAHFANAPADVARWTAAIGNRIGGQWTWSFTMHGPTEFYAVGEHGLAAKLIDADFVACISDFCRSQLMLFSDPSLWNKLHVVHCGVVPEEFPKAIGSTSEVFTIACVGRLVPEKGQAVLLEALRLLGRRGVAARVIFVGAGASQAWLQDETERLAVDAEFTGPVGQDHVIEILKGVDALCLPSFAEGLPVVLMEAMACGLPVVTTRIAGTQELVVDGVNGYVIAPGRADLLADALAKLALDPTSARAMGTAGAAKVACEFDVRREAHKLATLFREVKPRQPSQSVQQ